MRVVGKDGKCDSRLAAKLMLEHKKNALLNGPYVLEPIPEMAQKIREKRLEKSLILRAAASILKITPTELSDLETGRKEITEEMFNKIMCILGQEEIPIDVCDYILKNHLVDTIRLIMSQTHLTINYIELAADYYGNNMYQEPVECDAITTGEHSFLPLDIQKYILEKDLVPSFRKLIQNHPKGYILKAYANSFLKQNNEKQNKM